jgi:putative oxidoreductase
MPVTQYALPLTIIRFASAGNLLIHGIYRLSVGGVAPFDTWLSSLGFPPYTAWFITFFEVIGAVLILMDKWVSVICIIFMLQLIMGIALLHGNEGWFVVGGGRNGMEYSVLLIICFGAVGLAHWKKKHN